MGGDRKVLVTGGAGFIGSNLVVSLLSDGVDVVSVDADLRGGFNRLAGVQEKNYAGDLTLANADLRDKESCRKLFKNVDTVFHLAAINGTKNFYNRPSEVVEVGIKSALHVIELSAENGVSALIHASSAEAYQTPAVIPTDEKVPLLCPDPRNPRFTYGVSKIATEVLALHYLVDCFDSVKIFRPHNVYGENMGYDHVIPELFEKLNLQKNEETFSLLGSASDTRAFCHVSDAVAGIKIVDTLGDHKEIYHIGNPEEVEIGVVARKIAELTGFGGRILDSDRPLGSVLRRCPDITKISTLGYKPLVNLDRGLEMYRRWQIKSVG